ncbi:hypothetical protein [Paenibacillus favisporus]|uniref:hypothetical protein n=1 Tax=Paenibacillus favisporus TaxID=221028 RepID=UPI00197EAEDE|nr:hypothetical protein [Paenibacillus favisporus]
MDERMIVTPACGRPLLLYRENICRLALLLLQSTPKKLERHVPVQGFFSPRRSSGTL